MERVAATDAAGQRASIIMAPSASVLAVCGWLSKQASVGWRKRWYELHNNKLSWYNAASKKSEIGNLPLFLLLGVEDGPKPTQLVLRVKDDQKPQILLQAPTVASRDEWVKVLSLALEQRKARSVEDQMRGTGVDDLRSTSQQEGGSLSAATRHGSKRSSVRKGAPDDDAGGASSTGPIVEPSTVLEVEGELPSDTMSKEAQEKFTRDMRLLVLEKDVAAVRRMLDPKPPRDALVWFSKDELGRTLLHLAVDTGDLKVADLIGSADARLLELADQQGWLPLHLAAHKGSVDMGELLIKLGATIDPSDNHGRSPLYVALASGRVDFAKALLRRMPASAAWPAALVAALGGVAAHLEKEAALDVVHEPSNLTALHLASCNASAAEAVLFLIDRGLDVNKRDAHGKTPVHFAAVSGALQPLRVLLAKGADAATMDESKKTPLHFAAGAGHAEVAEMLLEKGCPHSSEDEAGWSPLHLACYHGHLPTVRVLIAKGARVDARGPRALTPLMMCCSDEVAPVAALLLQGGADANAIGRDGRTALFDAVLSQSLEVCKLLLKHEVNVNRPDEASSVAAHLAVDWPEGLLLLLENGAKGDLRLETGSTLLYEASVRGQLDVVKALRAKAGVDITSCTSSSKHLRRTGLHGAAVSGHLDLVKYYLAEVPDIRDDRDKDGRTALHLADSAPIMQALLAAGASAVEVDDGGNTPMHLAAEKANENCVRLLKQHGGVADAKNIVKKTPLHNAAEAKSYTCVSVLLEGCADTAPQDQDETGRTPLHYALRSGEVDSAIDLVWAGASPATPDADGVRPFHLAARLGKKRVLVEMVAASDPGWLDDAKRHPIHYAAAGGSADALAILLQMAPERTQELVRSVDSHGTTALHFAAEFNHGDCAKMLLEAGALAHVRNDVGLCAIHTAAKKGRAALEACLAAASTGPEGSGIDSRDNDALTPLLIAVLHGNVEGTQFLLESGADVNARDSEGMTAVHAALEPADALGSRILRLLVDRGVAVDQLDSGGSTALHLAASAGHVRALEVLLAAKADLNLKDGQGRAPLLLASFAGHTRCVEALCRDARLDLGSVNAEGANALHVATMNGKFEAARCIMACAETRGEQHIIKATDAAMRTALHNVVLHDNVEFTNVLLRKYAIDPNAVTTQKVTPLHEACVRGSLRCAKILLEAGANVNACALQGLTPLHNNDIIELLVQWKADINAASDRKLTAMHCAAAMSHSRSLVLLVKLGAEVDPRDANLETPLHKCASAGSVSCITCLIERGAEVNAVNDANERPVDKARRRKHARAVELLHENQ